MEWEIKDSTDSSFICNGRAPSGATRNSRFSRFFSFFHLSFPGKSPLLLQREGQSSSLFFSRVRKTQFLVGISQISMDTPREAEILNHKIPNPEFPGKHSLGKQGSDPHLRECYRILCLESIQGILSMSSRMGSRVGKYPSTKSGILHFFHPNPFPTGAGVFPSGKWGGSSREDFWDGAAPELLPRPWDHLQRQPVD